MDALDNEEWERQNDIIDDEYFYKKNVENGTEEVKRDASGGN